jgi:23S rRNA pseudouridine1911/1915/1917 synthase
MVTRTLTVDRAGRLDALVHAALPGWSLRLVRRLIAEGEVRLNGRPAPKGTRLTAGDRVTLPELPRGISPEPELALRTVYADHAVVVVEKPGGMPGHALDPRERGTAAAFLLASYPELADVGDPLAPGLVHRLDTGTSGLLVAARSVEAHARLRAALRARTVEKRYLAVVVGDASALAAQRLAAPLAHDPHDRRRMVAATPGRRAWPAETSIHLVGATAERSLVAATIRTGVTHQVRVHLALAGHPVLGDPLYGGPDAGLAPNRHALHACRITFPHPDGGHTLNVTSALPADLAGLTSWTVAP